MNAEMNMLTVLCAKCPTNPVQIFNEKLMIMLKCREMKEKNYGKKNSNE